MILFFGTKTGKKQTKTLNTVSCPYCAQKGTLMTVSQSNYVHLFWIPIFKLKTSKFAECSHCKRGFYEEEFTPGMEKGLNR
ncbi:zinc-ribbon domain-containing protein [Flagellimonas hymeniacidonis]|uniref:Zinc-ribbon domain-containing protein n=1 Tax=Flagellimonas hymeniacidonis TaxID=2603628 RepID=A0A5C8V715_9FLAO|nr:zinc-ribbon domain-containing protein [Flagellimonas hymeniacidonis]TXN36939.1 zinc-ribbon domain-containing protein [Flagellimonas hymeniacidonis]